MSLVVKTHSRVVWLRRLCNIPAAVPRLCVVACRIAGGGRQVDTTWHTTVKVHLKAQKNHNMALLSRSYEYFFHCWFANSFSHHIPAHNLSRCVRFQFLERWSSWWRLLPGKQSNVGVTFQKFALKSFDFGDKLRLNLPCPLNFLFSENTCSWKGKDRAVSVSRDFGLKEREKSKCSNVF